MLSIIIPSKEEKFLNNTIEDVLKKASGDIEVFVVLDGYDAERVDDKRVHYILLPDIKGNHKRQGINLVSELCRGKYIMSLDAHCMMDEGFDEKLAAVHEDDWVQVPRRHRLDADNWCLQTQVDDRPPIDYEYVMYPKKFDRLAFHGFKWDARTLEREEILVDDTMTMQASCWFMTLDWFRKNNFMDIRYQGWGQEAEEICFTTWLRGGKVKTNKTTWYAHLHKGKKHGRMYFLDKNLTRESYRYSYDFWMNNRLKNRVHDFDWLIDKFKPIGWPKNWREELGYAS